MQKKIALAIALAISTSALAEDLTPTFSVTQSGGTGVTTDPIQFSYRTGEVTGVTQLDPNTSYDGFSLSFDYSTYWSSGGMQSATDTLNYWFGGYSGNSYTLFDSSSWSLNGTNGTSGAYNYMYSGDTSGLTSLELKFSGMDGGYWAGMYGPKVTNVSLTSATTAAPATATPEPEPTNTSDGYCSPTDANDPDCSTSYTTASTSTNTSSDPLANIVPDSVLSSISDSTTTEDTTGVSNDITTVSTSTEATETVAQTTGQDTGIDDGQDTGTPSSTGEPEQTNDGSTQTVAETTGEPEPEVVAEVKEEVAQEASSDTTEEASGDTVASPGLPNIAGAPSVSDIVGNSMDFRSSSEKRASSFLNSVGVNTGAWTGTESNTYGVSFQNGVAGGGVGNQSFGMPSDPTDVAFDSGAPVSGIPSIIDSPIMDVSNQSSMNDGSVVLAQNTYGNSQDFSRVFDVKAKEAVPTTVVPGNNSLGQEGMSEQLSVSDLGGIDINTFKQNNMPDNSNWYSDQNRLQQNSIYENQDFYESKEIYNNTGWYK